jgi:hypothetical protein
MGLQESMRRFDAARGKPDAIGHPPVCSDAPGDDAKPLIN